MIRGLYEWILMICVRRGTLQQFLIFLILDYIGHGIKQISWILDIIIIIFFIQRSDFNAFLFRI